MTNAYAQKAVKRVEGMTPARYDVLALLREVSIRFKLPTRNDHNFMLQSAIIRRLGLSPSTISKMLKRMEEMRWIRRYRDRSKGGDARMKLVELTDLGLRRAHRAMSRVYRGRLLTTPFERICRQLHPNLHVVAALQKTWDPVDAIARFFGDHSELHYEGGSARERGAGRPPRHYDAARVGGEATALLEEKTKRAPRTRPLEQRIGSTPATCERIGFRVPSCSGERLRGAGECAVGPDTMSLAHRAMAVTASGDVIPHERDVRCHHRFRPKRYLFA